jgi:hypothetical protein
MHVNAKVDIYLLLRLSSCYRQIIVEEQYVLIFITIKRARFEFLGMCLATQLKTVIARGTRCK